jgi:hypothetical protein
MSQYQLIPYNRIQDHFQDQMHIPVSAGSIFNFNKEAYDQLELFEQWAKNKLAKSDLMHADETGIKIGGKRHWLHCASNASLTWFYPHTRSMRPWMRWVFCLSSKGCYVMTTGSRCPYQKPYPDKFTAEYLCIENRQWGQISAWRENCCQFPSMVVGICETLACVQSRQSIGC